MIIPIFRSISYEVRHRSVQVPMPRLPFVSACEQESVDACVFHVDDDDLEFRQSVVCHKWKYLVCRLLEVCQYHESDFDHVRHMKSALSYYLKARARYANFRMGPCGGCYELTYGGNKRYYPIAHEVRSSEQIEYVVRRRRIRCSTQEVDQLPYQ